MVHKPETHLREGGGVIVTPKQLYRLTDREGTIFNP